MLHLSRTTLRHIACFPYISDKIASRPASSPACFLSDALLALLPTVVLEVMLLFVHSYKPNKLNNIQLINK